MKKERISAAVSRMTMNNGQLDWLPKNPRQWTPEDVEKTRRSIDEDQDFLEDRPPLVVEHNGRLIVFAGNLRLTALKKTAIKSCPAILYTPEDDEDFATIKRRAMKDNGSFGSWDFDTLANEWGDMPLTDWGIPAWEERVGAEENTTHEDNFIEEDEDIRVICKRGDVWELGDHRLMCGDSIDLEDVKKLMGGGQQTSF